MESDNYFYSAKGIAKLPNALSGKNISNVFNSFKMSGKIK